jgi:hypothetical protein
VNDDVRERAVQAATDALLEWGHDGEIGMSFEVVDAVVAVVAPEIARPLQARIEELEGALREASDALAACNRSSEVQRSDRLAMLTNDACGNARAVLVRGERP